MKSRRKQGNVMKSKAKTRGHPVTKWNTLKRKHWGAPDMAVETNDRNLWTSKQYLDQSWSLQIFKSWKIERAYILQAKLRLAIHWHLLCTSMPRFNINNLFTYDYREEIITVCHGQLLSIVHKALTSPNLSFNPHFDKLSNFVINCHVDYLMKLLMHRRIVMDRLHFNVLNWHVLQFSACTSFERDPLFISSNVCNNVKLQFPRWTWSAMTLRFWNTFEGIKKINHHPPVHKGLKLAAQRTIEMTHSKKYSILNSKFL